MSTKSKQQLQTELKELVNEKTALMQAKTASPSKFTKKQQERLDTVAELVIDLEEQIELAEDSQVELAEDSQVEKAVVDTTADNASTNVQTNNGYKPKPGTENLVHLKIVRGRRFDENTGKEVSTPYIQQFTYGEYLNFIKKAELIGYTIVEELYNPYKK